MTTEPRRKPGPKPRFVDLVRVTVMLPKALMNSIEQEADSAKVSRSEIFRRRLGWEDMP